MTRARTCVVAYLTLPNSNMHHVEGTFKHLCSLNHASKRRVRQSLGRERALYHTGAHHEVLIVGYPMKVFQRYLCELCSNAIARQRGQDEIEFVVCATGAQGFPIDRRCPQFQFEDSIVE